MTAKSIEAGRAYVRTDADLNPLDKKLKQIESRFKNLGSKLSSAGGGLAKIGAGATAIGASILAPIAAATQKFTEFGDSIQKLGIRTGTGSEFLSELGFAAEQSGTNLQQVGAALFRFSRRVANATTETGPAVRALKELGIEAKSFSKLSTEDKFLQAADALSKMDDEARAAQLGFELFGDNFRQIKPLIDEGADGINRLRKEARELGVTLSQDDANAAADLGDALNRVTRSVQAAFIKVGAAVAGPLTTFANAASKITATVAQWVDKNRALVQQIAAVGITIAAVGTAVTAAGLALIGMGAAIASVGTIAGTAFAAVGMAISIATSPITLAVAAIAGIGYAVLKATGSLSVLGNMFGQVGETATTAWGGIVAAVSSGDLQTAGEIAFTALEVAWLQVTTRIREVWNRVADFFVNTWLSAVESIVQAGAAIYFGISRHFDMLGTALQASFDMAATYIVGTIDAIQTQIAKAIIKAQEFFGLFSAEQSQQVQSTLDSDLARRGAARQSGLDGRNSDRVAGLASREADRRQNAEQFGSIVADQFQRRRSQVDRSGLSSAQGRLADLQRKLAEQSEAAKRAAVAQTDSQAAQNAAASQGAAAAAMSSTSAGSVGTFVAGVAGRIAGGGTSMEDLATQQLSKLDSIDNRLREQNDVEE